MAKDYGEKMLYFDSQTTVPMTKEVVTAMMPYFTNHFVSPLSPHKLSRRIWPLIQEALHTLYEFVDADPEDHFILTSSGTEAVNHVVFSVYMEYARKLGKNHFLTTQVAEAPVIMAMDRLQEMASFFEMIPVNQEGIVTKETLETMITPRTCLVSLSWANGLTGVIQPLDDIATLCKQRGILLHIDGTHLLGKGNYSFSCSKADFLTFNGEQLHGPRGSGGLFIKKDVEIASFILGDKEQKGLRAGGVNMPTLIGLSHAVKQMQLHQDHYGIETASLRAYFEERLKDITINPFRRFSRVPNISCLLFPKIASDALGYYLDHENLYATFGGNHFQKLSHILKACHIEEKLIHCGMSFALSREHTKVDVDRAVDIIVKSVAKLGRLGVAL